jgi:hypothetical protein
MANFYDDGDGTIINLDHVQTATVSQSDNGPETTFVFTSGVEERFWGNHHDRLLGLGSPIIAATPGFEKLSFCFPEHDVLNRHQSHLVAKRAQLPRPVVRRRARLQANQTGRQLTEERQNLSTPKLLAQNRRSLCIDPVHLKNMLR